MAEPQMNADERRWEVASGFCHFPTDDSALADSPRTATGAIFAASIFPGQPGTEAHGTMGLE
jgi:hypothetical protein